MFSKFHEHRNKFRGKKIGPTESSSDIYVSNYLYSIFYECLMLGPTSAILETSERSSVKKLKIWLLLAWIGSLPLVKTIVSFPKIKSKADWQSQ